MDLIISFDDTGSMNSVRKIVRNKIEQLVNHLFLSIPDLRLGLIVHNDYCNSDVLQQLDFTTDRTAINKFINIVTTMGGGANGGECYELALNHMHSKFSWSSDRRAAILIGDEHPHKIGFKTHGQFYSTRNETQCTLDWKQEAKLCKENGISVYTIQALYDKSVKYFYEGVAQITGAIKLDLNQFEHIIPYITAIAYKENNNLEAYEESDPSFKTNYALVNMFNKLKGMAENATLNTKLETLSKFQLCTVDSKTRIKDYVEHMGISYKAGRGFYQLVKSETVQPYKEIFMVHKLTGDTISDNLECRKLLHLGTSVNEKIKPQYLQACKEYDVFIQSTSYTRNLDPNTKFLYEMS